MTQLSIYFYIKLISTLSKQSKIIPEERSTSPTKTRYSPLIFHVQTPIIRRPTSNRRENGSVKPRGGVFDQFSSNISLHLPRSQSLCMHAKLRNRIRPSAFLYSPTFLPFSPFFSLSFLSFLLLFFSFRSTVMAPRLPLGWPARNTPGGFVTGGWPGSCGLAEPALTFYGYHATTARAKSKSHSR